MIFTIHSLQKIISSKRIDDLNFIENLLKPFSSWKTKLDEYFIWHWWKHIASICWLDLSCLFFDDNTNEKNKASNTCPRSIYDLLLGSKINYIICRKYNYSYNWNLHTKEWIYQYRFLFSYFSIQDAKWSLLCKHRWRYTGMKKVAILLHSCFILMMKVFMLLKRDSHWDRVCQHLVV